MKEYSDIVNFGAIILTKENIIDLIKIMKTDIDEKEFYSQEYNFYYENTTYKFKNLEELIDNFPENIEKMSLSIMDWKDNKIVSKLTIDLQSNYNSYHISSKNETWFYGKKEKINRFFKEKKAWYSFINKGFPYISGTIQGIFIALLIVFITIDIKISIFSLGILLLSKKSFSLYQKNKLFPINKIILEEKKAKSVEFWTLIVAILTFIVTLIGVVYSMIK